MCTWNRHFYKSPVGEASFLCHLLRVTKLGASRARIGVVIFLNKFF